MYLLKIKGSSKIPDYLQIRDQNFTLIAYFRIDQKSKGLLDCGLSDKEAEIEKIVNEIPFGKIYKLPF